jgi:hypothetical protein
VSKKHSAKRIFAECQKKHSAKALFAECFFSPSVFVLALGKESLCRVPEKLHSAKQKTLGKDLFSGVVTSYPASGPSAPTQALLGPIIILLLCSNCTASVCSMVKKANIACVEYCVLGVGLIFHIGLCLH